jgi:soluble lytic murein transglycosylase
LSRNRGWYRLQPGCLYAARLLRVLGVTGHTQYAHLAGPLDDPLLCLYKNAMHRHMGLLVRVAILLTLTGCVLPSQRNQSPSEHPGVTPIAVTATSEPAETPTETPVPIVRVSSGDKAFFNGDIEAATNEYRTAANDATDPDVRMAALWGLAKSQYADAHYGDAIVTLDQLANEFPGGAYTAAAQFLRGQCLFATQHFQEAAAAYQTYLDMRPGVLDSYVSDLRGDALAKIEDYAGALTAYKNAQAAPHLDDAQALQIKIGQTTASAGDTDGAIALFDNIASNTTNDYTRAQMDYLAGEAYLSTDRSAAAYDRFKHSVENYPLSYYSYLGLVELIGAGIQVNDLDRGLTDYYAGVPDKGLEALQRYIAAGLDEDGTAHYYQGLCLSDLQKYPEAVQALTDFINAFPNHPRWTDAWDEKSTIQWLHLNFYPEGAQTMLDFVSAAPNSPHAPEALMIAARIYDRDGRFDQAADAWRRVGDEYSTYELAPTALVFAGLMQYRQSDFSAALPDFQRSLVLATTPEDQARAYLWIGKTQTRLGGDADAQNAWQLAQSADPGGYYSERASDLLMGRAAFAPPANLSLDLDLAQERKAADAWMRLTFKLPAETDLSGLDTLSADPRLIRGREFWNLGLYDEARLEFEDLRTSVSSDPVLTYRLANYLLDLGLYRSGITAARQVLSLAGLVDQSSSMLAPPYFTHVRYGLYYSDLIVPEARKYGIDPLFLFSVVRQESLFEGFVSSTAGARGLMQIIPATGADIAHALGWPFNYDADQLYRPLVSITLGSYYLASNQKTLDGDIYAALAAYNSGPGNAAAWKTLAPKDQDEFLETVRAQETRDYIRSIYEIYSVYRRLYGSGS